MPTARPTAVSSLSSSRVPTTAKSRLATSTSAANRMSIDNGSDDDLGGTGGASKIRKTTTGTSAASKGEITSKSSNARRRVDDLSSDEEQSPSAASSSKLKSLEARVQQVESERDELASQFEEINTLRSTTAEKDLTTYKKAAESRFKHQQDLISTLKHRLESVERKLKIAKGASKEDEEEEEKEERAREEEAERLKAENRQLKREAKEANDKAKRLSLELRTEVESSRALLSSSSNKATSSSSSALTDADAKALRRLYEDLTGIAILRVESCGNDDDGQDRRRFTGIFSATGHHDLQLSLEESSSVTEDSDTLRQDLIFLPSLDQVRDEALLKARTLPEYLQEEIRFDRGLSIKFLERLGRGLKK